MAAAVTVGTIIDFVGMECLVQGLGCGGNIFKEERPFLRSDVHQFADMILVSHNDPAGVALLLEQNQLADLQITDFDAEACQNLAAHAIAAVVVFHKSIPSFAE